MRALRILTPLVLSLVCGVSAAAQSTPAKARSVQADIETVYTLPDGKQTTARGRFFRNSHGQVREDSGLGAIITDVKAGTVTILVAQTKEARVMRIPESERPQARANRPAAEVFEETTVNGLRISKSRLTGPDGQRMEVWTAKDLGVVTLSKLEASGMTTVRELKNVSTQEPSPALFRIPADYKVVQQELTPAGQRPKAGAPQRPAPGTARGRGGIQ